MSLQISGLVHAVNGAKDGALDRVRTIQARQSFRESGFQKQARAVELTKEQEAEIDRLYLENYGKKIPYAWHKLFTSYTGRFDATYFPDLLFTPRFERFENLWSHYVRVLPDKNLVPLLACKAGIHTPEIILSCTKGLFRDGGFQLVSGNDAIALLQNAGEVFIKPTVGSNSGKGCFVSKFENGVDVLSGKSVDDLLTQLGTDFAVQERLVCHQSIRQIYAGSVNTFRVMTYLWKDELLLVPAIMRIGRGKSVVDNAGAGGIFIAIDDDGRLHKRAFNEGGEAFERHPDSGILFENYQIPHFAKVLAAAKRMHGLIPQLGVVNWDFTLDDTGEPTLIEMNPISACFFLPQMAHGKGPFGENTKAVLQWLRLMEHTKPADRVKYAFGKGV